MNHKKTPKFLSGYDQFTVEEVLVDRKICKLGYTCEVTFSRMLDSMNHWGHATVNLDALLMRSKYTLLSS
eukprot:scaffold124957_cov70-Cyclotella_meneghiniana.AAC.2